MIKVLLDPGHSEKPKDFSREDEICLKVCNLIQKKILDTGGERMVCAVIPVVDAEGTHLDLMGKVGFANKHNFDCYISIHINWSDTNTKAKGYTIYIDDQKTPLAKESSKLAEMISGQFTRHGLNYWNGQAIATDNLTYVGNLAVCSYTNMPSVLIELGFLSNLEEAKWLENIDNQKIIVDSIYNGIENFFL